MLPRSIDDLVFYEKKEPYYENDELVGHTIHKLYGIRGSQDRYIYEWYEYDMNRFSDTESQVPDDYTELNGPCDHSDDDDDSDDDYIELRRPSKNWISEVMWNPHKTRIQPLLELEPEAEGDRYFVHDNGGRPFMVCIRENSVSVFRQPESEYLWDEDWDEARENPLYYKEHLMTFENPIKIWISHDYFENCHGNTILIQINNTEYVWIGQHISKFFSNRPIIASYSNLGNNDVPYPVALTDSDILFLLDDVQYSRSDFNLQTEMEWADAYMQFYGHTPGLNENAKSRPIEQCKTLVPRSW
jgi:hypothetical protein